MIFKGLKVGIEGDFFFFSFLKINLISKFITTRIIES